MGLVTRVLIKILSLLYLAMAVLGLLGYLKIGVFPTNIFSIFVSLMGSYSLFIPGICLLFFIICWHISRKPKYEFDDNDDEFEDEADDIENSQRGHGPSSQRRINSNSLAVGETSINGFNDYFSGHPLIIERPIKPDRLKKLGTDYDTYFGQGERNIYLPVKTVSINGFNNYFKGMNTIDVKRSNETNEQSRKEIKKNLDLYEEQRARLFQVAAANDISSNVTNRRISFLKTDDANYFYDFAGDQKKEDELPTVEQQKNDEEDEEIEETIKDEEILKLEDKQLNRNNDNCYKIKSSGYTGEPAPKGWQLPTLELLNPPKYSRPSREEHQTELLEDVLNSFGVTAKVINISEGPVLTRYELSPAPGTKISKIVSLADDIALALASRDVRIEAPIPGKAAVGIEIPREKPQTVYFREVIDTDAFKNSKAKLRIALGKNIANEPVICELEKMPHLLVAGATGSGKSIFINCLINSLLYTLTPDEVRLLMVDPKIVELSQYNGIPHLLAPVITDPKKANKYLQFIIKEMENRYELFAVNGVRDIDHYNKDTEGEKLPHIIVIIDELADLMMVASNEIEESICRLAQMSRAAGIHLVIATQRPSVNVITGLIKANIPSRISFAVSSQIDSRTILDTTGAEKLLGRGDMLYSPIGLSKPLRVHGCFIDEQEIRNVINHWKNQENANYMFDDIQIEELDESDKKEMEYDDRFVEAGQLVISTGIASVSFLQRRLRVGYSRAARLMDMLEEAGVVGAYEGNKPREILMTLESFQNTFCS